MAGREEYVGSGTFLVNMKDRARKLKIEQTKVWRHRVGLLVRHLGLPVIIPAWYGLVYFLIDLAGPHQFKPDSPPDVQWGMCEHAVHALAISFFVPTIVGVSWFIFISPLVSNIAERFEAIKADWNPNTLQDRAGPENDRGEQDGERK